ncbi:hypothetical protein Vau01_013430 [Virgisporangium aurantiacum]|uniref:Uncharacterized protein n=1 Tax=Virgisporangium aurantiacum TaxID=175570 RepID=A0A8J3Z055_9ACTN|nr:hypothetical protein Vau01_013430 [Virgisporangium aurantiacum]
MGRGLALAPAEGRTAPLVERPTDGTEPARLVGAEHRRTRIGVGQRTGTGREPVAGTFEPVCQLTDTHAHPPGANGLYSPNVSA